MIVIKRDNRKHKFNASKIYQAIMATMTDIGSIDPELCKCITSEVEAKITNSNVDKMTVEQIQDLVQITIIEFQEVDLATNYMIYRQDRSAARDLSSSLMKSIDTISQKTIRDNANVGNGPAPKMLQVGSEASKWYNLSHMPKAFSDAHLSGDFHIHDLDYFEKTINCLQIDLADILSRGFSTNYGWIRSPKSIQTAAELLCIVMQSAQNDCYGGQSIIDCDNALAPYVEKTREKYRALMDDEKLVEVLTLKEVKQATQGIIYNLNSMHSRAGSQTIFSSLNIGLPKSADAALICEFLMRAIDEGLGRGETPIFPSIVFQAAKSVSRDIDSPYYYLYELAVKVMSKRMNPTILNCDGPMVKPYFEQGVAVGSMGCRTFTGGNVNGRIGATSRGNIAPVTINMPRLALKSKGDIKKFYASLDKMMILCEEQLLYRKSILSKLTGKDLPFITSQGLYYTNGEEIGPDDSIEPILKQGTYSIGWIGLAETLKVLVGKHHGESVEADQLGMEIILHMREFTDSARDRNQLNFVLYPTPAEGVSGRFPKLDEKMFGEVEWVTTKEFYSNSFHVPVDFEIGIKEKIDIEAKYHLPHNGGNISYIELKESPHDNPSALKAICDYFCEAGANYFGINFPIDECMEDGYRGIITTACPICGSRNINRIRRVTGYLSYSNRFTPGKVAELKARTSHEFTKQKIKEIYEKIS